MLILQDAAGDSIWRRTASERSRLRSPSLNPCQWSTRTAHSRLDGLSCSHRLAEHHWPRVTTQPRQRFCQRGRRPFPSDFWQTVGKIGPKRLQETERMPPMNAGKSAVSLGKVSVESLLLFLSLIWNPWFEELGNFCICLVRPSLLLFKNYCCYICANSCPDDFSVCAKLHSISKWLFTMLHNI